MHTAQLEIISSMITNPPEGFMAVNRAIHLKSASVFGREYADVDFAIADDYVSRKHFQITFMGEEAYLTDLNSRHGTFLNDEKISKSTRLQSGDLIRVGKTTLCFKLEPSKKPARKKLNSSADLDVAAMLDDMSLPGKLEPSSGLNPNRKPMLEPWDKRPVAAPSDDLTAGENRLESRRSDMQPQFILDPSDHALQPDILSSDSILDGVAISENHHEEADGPVFIDDFEVGALPLAKPVASSVDIQQTPLADPVVEGEKLTGEIELADVASPEVASPEVASPGVASPGVARSGSARSGEIDWKQLPSGWYECTWGKPQSSSALCAALDSLEKTVSLWSVIQFGKSGTSTPWDLLDCQPLWSGIPEPIAKCYGPVITAYSNLRKAVTPDTLWQLWKLDALVLLGGENAASMHSGLQQREWFRPRKGETAAREYPLGSSVFWHLWTHQISEPQPAYSPAWNSHISIVLTGQVNNSEVVHVLARNQRELPRF
jgi:pSer/pThr/pTyr-binding forkhead associated (FHA) protein